MELTSNPVLSSGAFISFRADSKLGQHVSVWLGEAFAVSDEHYVTWCQFWTFWFSLTLNQRAKIILKRFYLHHVTCMEFSPGLLVDIGIIIRKQNKTTLLIFPWATCTWQGTIYCWLFFVNFWSHSSVLPRTQSFRIKIRGLKKYLLFKSIYSVVSLHPSTAGEQEISSDLSYVCSTW